MTNPGDMESRLAAALGDRYALERPVGQGGMAMVYLARDLRHHRSVAIKVLRPELAASIGADRFLREIETAARLQHPHILPLYDSGASAPGAGERILYYVMPFVEGESLRDRLRRERQLPVEESLRIAREVAGALEYAHSHGIVHRDIKPENILLSGGHAVVADFGIARALGAASAPASAPATGGPALTGLGIAIGTPAYMSPEQATASDEVDGRADQYSLGCVLYEMLAGEPAFTGTSMQSVLMKSVTGPRPKVRRQRRDVPAAVDAAIQRAMAREPADRFPSMAEFSAAIDRAALDAMPTGRRWRALAAAVLVGVAGTAGFAGFAASRRAGGGSVVSDAQQIAVLPFRTTGPGVELLGEGMVDLLSTNLDQLADIRTVEPRTVLQRWKKLGASGGADLEQALAVGREVGARAVLLGSVVATGPRVRLTAELVARDGNKLARAQVEGAADSVLHLVDDLGLELVREVWRSKEPIPSLRVSGLTTTSVEAMRDYLRGEQLYRRGAWDSAAAAFNDAIAHDSTFALAQYRLAMTHGWTGASNSREALRAGAAAVRYGARLPNDERTLVTAYHLFQEGNPAATDTMSRYVASHPNDADGWYLLGESQYHTRALDPRAPDSLRLPFERVLAIDPSLTPAAIHPIEIAMAHRDTALFQRYLGFLQRAGADEEVRRYRAAADVAWGTAAPDTAHATELFGGRRQDGGMTAIQSVLGEGARDPDRPIARIEQITSAWSDRPVALQLRLFKGLALAGLGRLRELRALSDSLPPGMNNFILITPVLGGFAPKGYTDSLAAALEKVSATRKVLPGTPEDAERTYYRAVYALGRGDPKAARPLIEHGLALDTAVGPSWAHGAFEAADGWYALATGDTVGGLAKLKRGLVRVGPSSGPAVSAPLRLQWALALAARPETRQEGIAHLRYGLDMDPQHWPVASYALGQALEAARDRAGAADAYSTFLRYWKGADPAFQPQVTEARKRLAELTAEPRS